MAKAIEYGTRLALLRLGGSLGFLLLIGIGIAYYAATQDSSWTLPLFIAAIVVRFGTVIAAMVMTRRWRQRLYDEAGPRWWHRKGAVMQSMTAPGPIWDGPYATREDAEHAPEIARERAAAWKAED